MTLSKLSQYKIIKIKSGVAIATQRQISLNNTLIIGTVGNKYLAVTPINITPFWFSTNICHKVALTINK